MRRSAPARAVLALALCLGLPGIAPAADPQIEAPLRPPLAAAMAQGGALTAAATGFDALFHNPAGLSAPKGELTIYGLTTWVYADPLGALLAVLDNDPLAAADFATEQIEGGGFGFGMNEGIAYVGRGVAMGVVINLDAFLRGAPAGTAAAGDLYFTVAFYTGYAQPFRLGPLTLSVGVVARPMFRLHAPRLGAAVAPSPGYSVMQDFVDALLQGGDPMATLNTVDALFGIALGVDLGLVAELGHLRLGLTVTDVAGTRFHYTQDAVGDILTSLQDTGALPAGGPAVYGQYIPAALAVGASYRFAPPALQGRVDARVHASLTDLVEVMRESRSVLLVLHAGGEVRLWNILALRGGFNQGYLTFGLGAALYVLDLNLAYFSREMGSAFRETAGRGLSVEATLRLPPRGLGAGGRPERERRRDRRKPSPDAEE